VYIWVYSIEKGNIHVVVVWTFGGRLNVVHIHSNMNDGRGQGKEKTGVHMELYKGKNERGEVLTIDGISGEVKELTGAEDAE
jgi:hypothetical protein